MVKWLKVSDAQMAVNLLANAAIPNGASIAGGEVICLTRFFCYLV